VFRFNGMAQSNCSRVNYQLPEVMKFAKKFENQLENIEYGTSWTYETWKFAVLASKEGSESFA
jgi:O6-methylguanine-DNA--protein-cysteine methyltransferase